MKRVTTLVILLFFLSGITSFRIQAQEKKYTIENCVNQFDMDKAIQSESGYRYWFADKDFIDGRTLKMSVVKPNQATHPPHAHEVDEFFFVLEGKARFYLDGDTVVAGPYTSFYCPSGIDHGISNAGDTELKYLVIKKYPKPESKTTVPDSNKSEESNSIRWGILDHSWRSLVYNAKDDWYESKDALRVADNVLLYQLDIGGWPKNTPMHQILSEKEKKHLIELKSDNERAILDNGATIAEMDFLSKIYKIHKDERYKDAFLKGLDYIFEAQYENGGWPQKYPIEKDDYSRFITYNDEAMIHALQVMKDISDGSERFSIEIDPKRVDMAREALEKGIECILKTQYIQHGELTAWCAQHDEKTLLPAKARSYELPSLSGSESAEIVRFLMSIDNPSAEVIKAVHFAVKWFEKVKIEGISLERFKDENGKSDRRVVKDKDAPPIWARFYELDNNRPYFCDRDGIIKYSLAEIGHERRNGYGWYTIDPNEMLKEYSEWKKQHSPFEGG